VPTIGELAEKKKSGKWTLWDRLYIYFIASRPFTVPWITANTFAGCMLAGFDLYTFILASLIANIGLFTVHYWNNLRDWARGVDKLEPGGSVAKPYTAASQLIPYGLMAWWENAILGALCLATATALFVLFAPKTVYTVALFAMGVFLVATYTDLFKPRGLGEVALFLGHGFGVSTFAYALTLGYVDLKAVSLGTILGLHAASFYTIDQWQDAVVSGFKGRVSSLAELLVGAKVSISQYYYGAITGIVAIHIAFVLMGLLPASTLKAILLLPLFHITGLMMEYRFIQGVLLGLTGMVLYPILMAL